jgi:hypothetical protein
VSDRIHLVREAAYYQARDLLRTIGNDWLDYGLALHPEERYNLARDGEKMALELSEAFGKLATLAEKEEA